MWGHPHNFHIHLFKQYMSDTDADFTVMRHSPGDRAHGRWQMQGSPSFNSYLFPYACQKGKRIFKSGKGQTPTTALELFNTVYYRSWAG